MVEAAKDLERAARYEMASAKASPQKLSGKSILSAFADEVKKLSHLTTQSSKKEKDTGSWDAVEVSAMSSEVKKLDGLVEAIKGGKKPKDIVSGAQDSPSEDMGADAKAPDDSKEFEEKQQAKLSDAASRKDLDSFFDAMSLPEDEEAHVHDVGDTYDRLKITPALSSRSSTTRSTSSSSSWSVWSTLRSEQLQANRRRYAVDAPKWVLMAPRAWRRRRMLASSKQLRPRSRRLSRVTAGSCRV